MQPPKDPIMLLSFVNTRLRDRYSSLDDLCEDLNLDKKGLEDSLKKIGYCYTPSSNQFVTVS